MWQTMKATREIRLAVARRAEELSTGKITFDQFLSSIPAGTDADDDISELEDVLTHEPKEGGLLGVSRARHSDYVKSVSDLIERLKSE
jgi:hypothetical protein